MDDIHRADNELVSAVLANRPGAFARLVGEYQGLCCHILQRMVRNPQDVRELCQGTFLRVHQRLRQYRGESALKSWIGRVAWTIAGLKTPPATILSADFAQQMSTLATAQTPERTASMRLERVLMTTLPGVFLLAAVVVTLIYAATWRPLFEAALPASAAAQWLCALIGCVGVSWLLGAWPQLVRLANRTGGESA